MKDEETVRVVQSMFFFHSLMGCLKEEMNEKWMSWSGGDVSRIMSAQQVTEVPHWMCQDYSFRPTSD